MIRPKNILVIAWLCSVPCTLNAAETGRTLFRVIGATPTDFVYALRAPPSGTPASAAGESRLQKYLELTRKDVHGPEIEIEIQPNRRLVPAELGKYGSVVIKLIELAPSGDSRRFDATFILSKTSTIKTLMTVSPHTEGSLLRLDIQQSTLPTWIMQRTVDFILKLNLANVSPTGSN